MSKGVKEWGSVGAHGACLVPQPHTRHAEGTWLIPNAPAPVGYPYGHYPYGHSCLHAIHTHDPNIRDVLVPIQRRKNLLNKGLREQPVFSMRFVSCSILDATHPMGWGGGRHRIHA